MAKVTPATEQFQHFVNEVRESVFGELYGKTREMWKKLWEADSEWQRDKYCVVDSYERDEESRRDYRNGSYVRDYVTRLGTIKVRIARSRNKSFLPKGMRQFDRRAEDIAMLIREAFLRGVSTRNVGRLVALVSEEPVSAQTVSQLTRDLDKAVQDFHRGALKDEWVYLFLDGVSLRVRRPGGRKRVQMLVAYGVHKDGSRQLLAFQRSTGESQQAWEGFLHGLYVRGLVGDALKLIVTDGCPGLASALQTVYPRAAHQRCWAHKMRNIIEKARKRDREEIKTDAQAIYQADNIREARGAFKQFRLRWLKEYPSLVKQLERDLPELLAFFSFPRQQWKKLRTTNIIERCFVEVRRRTRPMVCFVNVKSVDRIIFSIFNYFNLNWKHRTLRAFTQAA